MKTIAALFLASLVLLLLAAFTDVFAADLALPKPRPTPGRVTDSGDTRSYTPVPTYAQPELCLQNGRQPLPGQTLVLDPTCPTKLRWKSVK